MLADLGMSSGAWATIGGIAITNLALLISQWVTVNVALKTLDLRLNQVEKDRHEMRVDVKTLTDEIHALALAIAKSSGPSKHE